MRLRFLITALMAICFGLGEPATGDFDDKQADREALPAVPDGFEITMFAREPLVRQPCSMAFDARGRLYVGMGPQYRNPTPETPGDSVVIVSDVDGDGLADRTKVFATGFNAVQGLAWHGRDLWVANAPDLTVVRDLDGDDEADEYVRVYTDLGNLEHGLHGLNWAPDGKLYMSKGNSKGLTQPGRVAPKPFRDLWGVVAPEGTPDFPEPQVFGRSEYRHAYHDPSDDWGLDGGVLRCDDGGANLQIVSRGFRNPWDIAYDSGFNWLGTDNDQTIGDRVFMPFWGAHFGWNHSWSSHWSDSPHPPTAPVSGPLFEGSGTGVVFGDSPQFPAKYRQVFFVNDWLSKSTFVWRPQWDGALMRPRDGRWEPVIVGGSALFRPTDIEFGPDGALWVLGWSSGYGAEYHDGQLTNEGRIYRLVWRDLPLLKPTAPKTNVPLAERSVSDLIGDFAGSLPVWRIDAQDELVRRGVLVRDELITSLTRQTLTEGQETWIAWTLARLPGWDESMERFFAERAAAEATRKHSLNLRIQSVRILGEHLHSDGSSGLATHAILDALEDSEPRVRMAAVQAMLVGRQEPQVDRLIELIARETDRTVFYAGWRTLCELASDAQLRSLLADSRSGVRRGALLALLETHALSRAEVDQMLAVETDSAVREILQLWGDKVREEQAGIVVRGRPIDVPNRPSRPDQESSAGSSLTLKRLDHPTTIDQALSWLDRGDATQGKILFGDPGGPGCGKCHSLDGQPNRLGPNLADIGNRAQPKQLVQAILDPSAVITEGFAMQTIETISGKTYAGVLLSESGLMVSLGVSAGERVDIPRSQIELRQGTRVSVMPSMAEVLTPQQVSDLVAFLAAQKAKPGEKVVSERDGPEVPGGEAAGQSIGDASDGQLAAEGPFSVEQRSDRLLFALRGKPIAEYVYADPKILRPYFSQVRTPGGFQVTRTHPPVEGVDAMDHDTMHPGIWLGFGKISGEDFWRNKGRMEHVRFVDRPSIVQGKMTFRTESRLLSADGGVLGEVVNRYELQTRPAGWRLTWEATFQSRTGELVFGDQEEMGLGVRVATALTEKNGGLIASSTGRRTAEQTWGQPARWCDYAGTIDGRPAGITILPAAGNFRESWWHNRDYGVFVANPFGRAAMKQGEASELVVPRGEKFQIKFSVVVHDGPEYDPDVEWRSIVSEDHGGR